MIARQELARQRDLVIELVKRDLRLRYNRSALGLAWALLNPLLQFAVFYVVFKLILPVGRENFALFLFAGLPAWNWLQNSLQIGCAAIVDHSALVRQPRFSSAILPLVTVSSNLLHLLLAMPIVAAVAWFHGSLSTTALLGLPFVIAAQFLLTLAGVYCVAALNVRFRDTQFLVQAALLFIFYLSPILYSAADVPASWRALYVLNPLVPIFEGYHQIFVDARFPALPPLLLVAIVATAALVLTYNLFMSVSRQFVEDIG